MSQQWAPMQDCQGRPPKQSLVSIFNKIDYRTYFTVANRWLNKSGVGALQQMKKTLLMTHHDR